MGGFEQGMAADERPDSGLACLLMLARFHNVPASAEQLSHEFTEDGRAFGRTELLLAAKQLGLKAKATLSKPDRLQHLPLPAIAVDRGGHFFILARYDEAARQIQRPQVLELEELNARWSGDLILVRSEASVAGDLARFDFTWFIPAIVKYRKLLGEVLLVSFVLQIFALLTPLFFQVVMDKMF